MTRRLLHEMYAPTPEGIIGNEDGGQMSGWYILSSLGIYSVCPGSNEFALTTPLFEKAVVNPVSYTHLDVYKRQPWYRLRHNLHKQECALSFPLPCSGDLRLYP